MVPYSYILLQRIRKRGKDPKGISRWLVLERNPPLNSFFTAGKIS